MSLYVNTDENEPEPFTSAEHRAQALRLLHRAGDAAGQRRAVTAANLLRAAGVHAQLALVSLMEDEVARGLGLEDEVARYQDLDAAEVEVDDSRAGIELAS